MTSGTMKAVITTGNGGYEKLSFEDVPVPALNAGEVLVKVLAAGVNNTEINTRLGWYSASVTDATNQTADKNGSATDLDGGWNRQTPFPFIQGTDCCGEVIQSADDENHSLVGERVLIRSCIREHGFDSLNCVWLGSDINGAFAQYVKVRASEIFPVSCNWSDVELATIPCAYGTSENMIERAAVEAGQTVLVAGASGGVGSASVQLVKRRGATVIAIVGAGKERAVQKIGADQIVGRTADLVSVLGEESVDVVIDNVAGADFSLKLKLLKRGGRLVSSGAIAGPIVEMDMRDMYLKDITVIGTTAWGENVMPNLVSYIEAGEIRPLVAGTFPLQAIADAQREFLLKKHVGNFVLIPPHDS